MNYKILVLALLGVLPASAKNDKILDMIRRIDPYGLNELHIPGFFIKADEKKRYEKAAREVTDKAYRSLHSVALYDVVRFVKGSLKGAAGAAAVYAGYLYSTGTYDISQLNSIGKEQLPVNFTLTDGKKYTLLNRFTMYGILGGLALYLLSDAKGEFANIYNKQQRVLAYHNALAQEAYIARLPVCDVGACETVLDE